MNEINHKRLKELVSKHSFSKDKDFIIVPKLWVIGAIEEFEKLEALCKILSMESNTLKDQKSLTEESQPGEIQTK